MALLEQYSVEGIDNAEPQKIDNDSLIKLQALGVHRIFPGFIEGERGEAC